MAAAEALAEADVTHMAGRRRRAQDGSTALMCAGYSGQADCARLLLDAGADKNAKANVRASAGGGGAWGVALGD